ncbi:hypothetical protein T4B_10320, partial [Trichinella pseudospiralis]
LQIRLDPEDKDVSRFFWRSMKEAMAALHHHAELNQAECVKGLRTLKGI